MHRDHAACAARGGISRADGGDPSYAFPGSDAGRYGESVMDDLSVYLHGIALAYSVALVGLMSPGPNILSVIGTSMGAGRRDGAMLALGVGLGAFGWGLLTLAGLSTLIRAYAAVVTTIKIAGGVYLLWL